MKQRVTAINGNQLSWEVLGGHREGPVVFKRFNLQSGIEGLNLEFSEFKIGAGYYTPRHRHNFDQIRYVIEGTASIARQRDMPPGMCGYFPEGVYYGPQEQKGEARLLLFQFPGASRTHFMSYDELEETYQMVKARGAKFEKGVYKGRSATDQADNKDGYEALWEAFHEQAISYPKPRYQDFILMDSSAFGWLGQPAQPGVEVKPLGTFSEQQTGITLERWQSAAQSRAVTTAIPEIRYLLQGRLIFEDATYDAGSCFYLPEGTTASFVAETSVEFFVLSLGLVKHWSQATTSLETARVG